MRILVSNDDGILSRGIHVLAEALKDMGEVTVVAPSQERSTNSHSLTLHKPLRITKMKPGHYHVNGTPADCVYLALKKIMKDELPDIVVSGINRGANLGYDVHYSGTVAAAREAAIVHIPSLAISLSTKQKEVDAMNFESAAQHAKTIVKLMQKKELPKGVFLNMNVPDRPHAEIKGIKVVRTGVRIYSHDVAEKQDPSGKSYYWLGGGYIGYQNINDTDCKVVEEGFISLTPLHVDATQHQFLEQLKNWNFEPTV